MNKRFIPRFSLGCLPDFIAHDSNVLWRTAYFKPDSRLIPFVCRKQNSSSNPLT